MVASGPVAGLYACGRPLHQSSAFMPVSGLCSAVIPVVGRYACGLSLGVEENDFRMEKVNFFHSTFPILNQLSFEETVSEEILSLSLSLSLSLA